MPAQPLKAAMPLPAAAPRPLHKTPLPNTYWVVPGRLLAGEHPGAQNLSDTTDRLQALLCAGVTMFVDLTEEGEVPEYSHLLIYAAGVEPIKYVRHSIGDHDIPDSPLLMQNILDSIDGHLAREGVVYLHCRAGIGRTGTAVGCYLTRCGLEGDGALDRLNELWRECERSQTWPSVPETNKQIEYIRAWQKADPKLIKVQAPKAAPVVTAPVAAPAPRSGKADRYVGAMLGMAIGDALGAVAAPGADGNAKAVTDLTPAPNLPLGAWGADTAMCWALIDSLFACEGQNPEDQMQRYLAWQRDGKYSSTGTALEVPADARKAIAQWQWTHKPIAGSHDPNNKDAHALARTLAPTLYFAADPTRTLVEAGESARTTLQAPIALDSCRVFATLLLDAMSGMDKEMLLSLKRSDNALRLRRNRLKLPVTQVMDGWWRGPTPPARTQRDVLAVLGTAMWAFDHTDNFRDGVLLAVNSNPNAATTGAVFGALAGAYYGANSIPAEWRTAVIHAADLTQLAQRLADR